MLTEKPVLSLDELEAQVATELPQRDTMLVTVVITNVLNNNTVDITISDNAVQVCAQLIATGNFECTIIQQ